MQSALTLDEFPNKIRETIKSIIQNLHGNTSAVCFLFYFRPSPPFPSTPLLPSYSYVFTTSFSIVSTIFSLPPPPHLPPSSCSVWPGPPILVAHKHSPQPHRGSNTSTPTDSPHAGSRSSPAPLLPAHLSSAVTHSPSPTPKDGRNDVVFTELTPVPPTSVHGGHMYTPLPSIGQFSNKPEGAFISQFLKFIWYFFLTNTFLTPC